MLSGAVIYPLAIFALRAVTWKEARMLFQVFLRRGRGVSDLTPV
jgi:hypothetical protein